MAEGQKSFYYLIGGIALAGAIIIGVKIHGSNAAPIALPANVAVLPVDTAGFRGYVTGSDSAKIEVTEYGDLECPGCQNFELMQFPDVQKRLIDTGKIRFRYRDYPWDELHKHPREAALAAACASDQGHFWDMARELFVRQGDWSRTSNPKSDFKDAAGRLGLDVGKWTDCYDAKKYAGRIQASRQEGDAVGIRSTPSFLIAGKLYEGLSSDQMVAIVDSVIGAKPPSKP
jgi:protein-disulfide isomerase